MVPVADESAPKSDEHFLDAAPPGCVIVISAPPGAANAVWGGLATARAIALGVRGTVVDGRVRDIAEMRADGYPVSGVSQG
ncbi:MAG: hypothetical protein BJ554DRAFT_1050 [Olpidium bornovanus]|uniref:Uncharacterized protein n=1 Tax=Olpidium bornovanus TaxID=278681 RepID=A0A8H7ZSV9_9FUNG|nr:MAG: hypothetical protein BJ554DRAFT_1050 [Olpidium bornovanus]